MPRTQRTHVHAPVSPIITFDGFRNTLLVLCNFVAHALLSAQNLTALYGGAIAAQLITTTAGLSPLHCLPFSTCKIHERNHQHRAVLSGTAVITPQHHIQHDDFLKTGVHLVPLLPSHKSNAAGVLSGKSTLNTLVHAARLDVNGAHGLALQVAVTENLQNCKIVRSLDLQSRTPYRVIR